MLTNPRQPVPRTAAQGGAAAAAVVIVCWVAALAHLDLDPGPGRDPLEVAAAAQGVLTWAAAVAMNSRSHTDPSAIDPEGPA